MNIKKQALYEEQTEQELGRAGQCQDQDAENIGYVIQIEPT